VPAPHPDGGALSMAVVMAEQRQLDPSAAENRIGTLLPSSSHAWRNRVGSPVSRRCGSGAAPVNLVRLSPAVQERARRSKQPRGLREERQWPASRSMTPCVVPVPRTVGQAAPQACPGRRQAHPLASLSRGGIGPVPTPARVSRGRRRRARTGGRSPSTPCPCRACSLSAPGASGPLHAGAATGRPLPRRPP
jgi:hypothetical protein